MAEKVQAVWAGRLQTLALRERKFFINEKILFRMRSRDTTIWSSDQSEQASILRNLAWLDLPDMLAPLFEEMVRSARAAISEGYSRWVFLALGSSSLAARALLPLITLPAERQMSLLDTSHPAAISRTLGEIDLAGTLFVLANKTGDKLEDHSLFFYFQHVSNLAGVTNVSQHFISLTNSNTFLANLSRGYDFRASLLDPPYIPSSYCSILHFGALMVALSVLDPAKVIATAQEAREDCFSDSPENPAVALGAFLAAAAVAQCRFLVFQTSRSLAPYSRRLGLLLGGSLARDSTGLIPICGRVPLDTQGFEETAAFVFLTCGTEDAAPLLEKMETFRSAGIPFVHIRMEEPARLLSETFKWEVAAALACAAIGVNPFDWLDASAPRRMAMDLLDRFPATPDVFTRKPRVQQQGIQLFAEGRTRAEISTLNLVEACRSFFRLRDSQGFLAIMVFLDRSPVVQEAVCKLRETLTTHLRLPVLLEFGPRCLDHYSYLFRNDLPKGIYLILTADYPEDFPVPGAAYTFSQLHEALCLGEFEKAAETDRFVIRLHLGGDLVESFKRLEQVFEQGFPRNP